MFSSSKLNFPRQNAKNIISTAMSFPSPFLAALKPPGFSSPRNFRNSTRGSWENKRRQLCWLFGLCHAHGDLLFSAYAVGSPMMPMWMPLQLVQSVKSAERHKVSEAGVLKKSVENELPFIVIVRN